VNTIEVRIPDLGDVHGVRVIEVLVRVGDELRKDDPLVTLESEKASMDVPSPVAGRVVSLALGKGAEVTSGTLIGTVRVLEASEAGEANRPAAEASAGGAGHAGPAPSAARESAPRDASGSAPESASRPTAPRTEAPPGARPLVVLGSGPGGYTAAFRAADLGLKVTLIERAAVLGGVCLNVGCIPSKALLHAAKVIEDAADMAANGIEFGPPRIDRQRLRAWKERVVGKLTGGLAALAKQRKVEVLRGEARFKGPHTLELTVPDGSVQAVHFEQCIIAAGSESVRLPGFPEDPRLIDSTGALELPPCERLLVIGGGIIGLEMACVYDALGAKVTVVELSEGLMPGTDRDLVRPLQKRIEKRYTAVHVKTRVAKLEPLEAGLRAHFEGPTPLAPADFDRVLVAVGRSANGHAIDAAAAGVTVDRRGVIPVDRSMRTNVPHIFAIGDIAGAPMLAHKATHEAKVAAEVAAGHKASFDVRAIPAVAYTDPEIAWVGLTETEAAARGLKLAKGVFPWAASGRSLANNRDDGFTKLLFDADSHRIVGGGIVGTNAGELIAEVGLAIEMNADAADIGLTVHAHPTLTETVAFAAEAVEGTLTDLYMPRR